MYSEVSIKTTWLLCLGVFVVDFGHIVIIVIVGFENTFSYLESEWESK